MVLPVVYIVIVPERRRPLDLRLPRDVRIRGSRRTSRQKRLIYSSQTNGVILDQDNNKHSGVYQGRPFPTVAPPTAPPLTLQPVDHTGDNQKIISLPFLRRKFDEFINNRNGAGREPQSAAAQDPAGLVGRRDAVDRCPRATSTCRRITAGEGRRLDGSLRQQPDQPRSDSSKAGASPIRTSRDINSAALQPERRRARQPTPVTLTRRLSSPADTLLDRSAISARSTLDRFSITLKLTLDKARSSTSSASHIRSST